MIEAIRRLPLKTYNDFIEDSRTAAAAESYLRRALESVFDLGRHIMAKGFAASPAEYKAIVATLAEYEVLTDAQGRILRPMAGYRNRMAHFYNEIGAEELYNICRNDLADIEIICDAFIDWINRHPDKIDTTL